MTQLWSLQRGARVLDNGAVHFAVWAPRAKRVSVRLTTGPAKGDHELAPSEREPGLFEATVENAGADAEYGYVLDGKGDRLLPDPVSRYQPRGVHDASRVVDPRAFEWSDDGWRGRRMADLVIYELHVGTFTHEGTFAAVIPHLAELRALGVTAIEIMPVAQFPGSRNWGYDGVGLYAVQNSYGGPVALKQLVDAAHAHGLAVILDVVYNHLGPEGNYLNEFGPYFTEKYRTPWGPALNYDDADSDDVRRFVVDNALYWITEYHVDGLRLDAVHGIFDFSAIHLLQEIAGAVHEQGERLGRTVVVIGESDLNDPKLVRTVEEYGYGLDAQWSDDFHHAVHAALTGETSGYYSDFGAASLIAAALEEPFVYAGAHSTHRRRRHGASSVGLPRERFVVAIQNHDQVGNRAVGERLAVLLDPAALRLATALLLLSPYVPLIFMGEEYGETNPFLYFVSHGDEGLNDAVREGRRKEFESFGWGDDVPDPAAEETFRRSLLDRSRVTPGAENAHTRMLALYRDLLALRRDEPMLRPGGSEYIVDAGEQGWITLLREQTMTAYHTSGQEADSALLAVFNCSGHQVELPVPSTAHGAWRLRFSTDSREYGGAGDQVTFDIPDGGEPVLRGRGDAPRRLLAPSAPAVKRAVALPPWSAALYERVSTLD